MERRQTREASNERTVWQPAATSRPRAANEIITHASTTNKTGAGEHGADSSVQRRRGTLDEGGLVRGVDLLGVAINKARKQKALDV